ncbi:hypothetical protein F5Y19DRAFT_404280 [Xylariaceae sp. FL1651]|nr:hypothetical protein F5Y19DRAFT_404280 [Xylariaceae sp. FL1651]
MGPNALTCRRLVGISCASPYFVLAAPWPHYDDVLAVEKFATRSQPLEKLRNYYLIVWTARHLSIHGIQYWQGDTSDGNFPTTARGNVDEVRNITERIPPMPPSRIIHVSQKY